MTTGKAGSQSDRVRREGAPAPRAFFQSAEEKFAEAVAVAGAVDISCEIGGYSVALRFAGEALVPSVMQALRHVVVDARSNHDFTVCLWDDVSSGVQMPPPPWSQNDHLPRAGIHGFSDDRIRTAFNGESGVVSLCDLERNLAIFWIRDASQLRFFERAAPLLYIFSWWMSAHGRQLAHGGAVGSPEGGAVIVGKSGSGKSSTCLRSLNSPLFYAGDDYCLLASDPEPWVHSLYSAGKVTADNLVNFPFLRNCLSNLEKIHTEDARFFLYPEFAHKLSRGFPLRAILLPRVTGRPKTAWHKVSEAKTLMALAPSTILQLPEAGGAAFRNLAALTRRVPGYALELGTDVDRIPFAIAELLSQTA